jgi:DNA-binding beta-propeller fold protein YncE
MQGDGRQAVLSPDRQILYTLYTHQPDHQHTRDLIAGRRSNVHAFVHVLHLTERWAYCLDLPHPFGEGPADGHAVAVSADGRRLAVVDVTSGSLAYADTAALTVERVVRVPAGTGAASLVLTPDSRRAFIGAATTVALLDCGTDAVTASWSAPSAIRGLGLSRDAARVYAGGADEIVWFDAGSGAVQGRAAVDGLIALRHVR